jgi:hypothetical protein
VQGRGESNSASSSPSSLSSTTSHHRFAAFLVRLAGVGDAIGEGCVSGAGGAGGADAAVGSTKGGSSEGHGARFIGRGSRAASSLALDGLLSLTAVVASWSR